MGKLLARIYRKTFWQTYDNIGRVLLLNLIWFVVFPLVTFLLFRMMPGGAATGVGSAGPAAAGPAAGTAARLVFTTLVALLTSSFAGSGVFALMARLARREQIAVKQFLAGAHRFFLRTLALAVIFGAALLLLLYSIRFYAGALGILGFFLAGIQIWILAFVLLMQVHALPLLFVKDWGIRRVIKWSAILVVLRPGLSVLLFIQAAALFGVLAFTGIGLVLLAYCVVSLFLCVALRETLRDLEAKWSGGATGAAGVKPTSWKEIFAEEDRRGPGKQGQNRGGGDDEDDEENRTLKDVLRPWDN